MRATSPNATESLSGFRNAPGLAGGLEIFLVVKSLDQVARRKRLIETREQGRIGRVAPRPVADGLVVRTRLSPRCAVDFSTSEIFLRLPEPRAFRRLPDGRYGVNAVDRVLVVGEDGRIERSFTHPYFAFLHSLDVHPEGDRVLVVSAGFDALFEIDLGSGAVSWEWFGWDHGFNPTERGVYLTNSAAKQQRLAAQGFDAEYVDPRRYGAQGLLTGYRTTHPSHASYGRSRGQTIMATLGKLGQVIEIDRDTGDHAIRVANLAQLPHAIIPYADGWLVTNTLEGELWMLDAEFAVRRKLMFRDLPGKAKEAGDHEWLQAVYPIGDRLIGIDANRGLIIVDPKERAYAVVPCDPNWCIQDLEAGSR